MAVVCWQVAELLGDPAPTNSVATATDITGAPIDDAQMRQMVDTLNTLENDD